MEMTFEKPDQAHQASITAFWKWWAAEGDSLVMEALDAKNFERVDTLMAPQVKAISAELIWEITLSKKPAYKLCVSSGGKPEGRHLAAAWLLEAPESIGSMQFIDAKGREPEWLAAFIDVEGTDIRLNEAKIKIAPRKIDVGPKGSGYQQLRLDVVISHPVFAKMSEQQRLEASFKLLDFLLGEDDVMTWIGNVETTTSPDRGFISQQALVEVIANAEELVKGHVHFENDSTIAAGLKTQ